MSGRFVRASSYRHVHGKVPKPEHEYHDLKPTIAGDGNHIAANDKFFAYSGTGGGGPVVVWPIAKTGRLPLNTPMLTVHKDVVLDYDFSPFVPNLLATGGEDLVIKISSIPEEGLKANQSESVVSLEGHERKVNILHWHPTSSNVLGSSSSDGSVKVWDVEKATPSLSFNDFGDVVHSFEWNSDGSLIATSSKDLSLRVFDPRNPSSAVKGPSFTGPKVSRVQWRGDKGQILAVGCSKSSARQYGLWDLKMMNQPLTVMDIDTSAGILIPHFDADTGMLYAAGKGDGNIRYWEVVDTDPYVHFLSEFRDNASQKGICFLPKRACDAKQCEVAVALRLMKDKVIPISFQVPRKSADTFQKDLYPDAYAGIPSQSADEYFAGKNAAPKKVTMDWKDKAKNASAGASSSSVSAALKPQKTAAQLQSELDAANARIAELEAEVARLKAK